MERNNANRLQLSATVIGLVVFALVCVGLLTGILLLATEMILILFLGILFGVFLSRLSRLVTELTSLSYPWSLGGVTALLLATMGGLIALFGVQVDSEISAAMEHADEGIEQLKDWADDYPTVEAVFLSTPFLRQLLEEEPAQSDSQQTAEQPQKKSQKGDDLSSEEKSDTDSNEDTSQAKLLEQGALRSTARKGAMAVAGVFRSSLGLLVNSLLIFFTGMFLAIDPGMYRDGLVKLSPLDRRERTREILNLMGDTLWQWLIGQFGTMTITGVGAGLLLWILGVPMAFTLGVVTALLTFIPNIGPAVALVLAILFALPQGSTTVIYVVGGYILLQLLESYVLTPLIQQKQAALPPALLLAIQALMGVIFGLLGAAVASPLLAVSKVGIEEAYVADVLEKSEVNE